MSHGQHALMHVENMDSPGGQQHPPQKPPPFAIFDDAVIARPHDFGVDGAAGRLQPKDPAAGQVQNGLAILRSQPRVRLLQRREVHPSGLHPAVPAVLRVGQSLNGAFLHPDTPRYPLAPQMYRHSDRNGFPSPAWAAEPAPRPTRRRNTPPACHGSRRK